MIKTAIQKFSTLKIAYFALAGLALVMLAVFVGLKISAASHQRAAAESDGAAFRALAARLAPLIRPETATDDQLAQARVFLGPPMKTLGRATDELAAGAVAFLGLYPFEEDLKKAESRFEAAALLMPDSPDIASFQGAASLRLGNTARAEELYVKALALKKAAGYDDLQMSSDQLGLALCLFLLHRADEALPPAQAAWETRLRELGPAAFETISAANRLSTILVALSMGDEAEALLKQSYLDGLSDEAANAAVLEEARLFLLAMANSSGRLAEMDEFFAAAVLPQSSEEPEPRPEPEPAVPPATSEDLAAWKDLADRLKGHNDALSADLLIKVILGRQELEGLDLYDPALEPLHLELVQAYMDSGQFGPAEEQLRPILMGLTDRQSEEFLTLSILMARIQEGAGHHTEAESRWQAAAAVLDARLAAERQTKAGADPATVDRVLEIHSRLAENILKQGRAAAEAELELRAALALLNAKKVNSYPGTAEIYLKLARLLNDVPGRAKDRADYYRRAKRAAETAKRSADTETKARLDLALAAVNAETAKGTAKKAEGEPVEKPWPEPDVLRLELSALGILGRLSEFQPRIEAVLAEVAEAHGDLSPIYMRYYSLKLKGLEEEGRLAELTAELRAQARKPLGRNEAERALNRSSALAYAARANEKAGEKTAAVQLYQQALEALGDLGHEPIANRRRQIRQALDNLEAASQEPGQGGQGGGFGS